MALSIKIPRFMDIFFTYCGWCSLSVVTIFIERHSVIDKENLAI